MAYTNQHGRRRLSGPYENVKGPCKTSLILTVFLLQWITITLNLLLFRLDSAWPLVELWAIIALRVAALQVIMPKTSFVAHGKEETYIPSCPYCFSWPPTLIYPCIEPPAGAIGERGRFARIIWADNSTEYGSLQKCGNLVSKASILGKFACECEASVTHSSMMAASRAPDWGYMKRDRCIAFSCKFPSNA